MSSPNQSARANPDGSATTPRRIVFALTERERGLFFKQPVTWTEQAVPHWLSEAELKTDGWIAALQRLRPQVLVTGWSTPPLPEAWVDAPDCPLLYVCHVTGSVRRLVPRSFVARGGLVSNWGDTVSPQVAEHALLLALAALRNQAGWRPFIDQPATVRHIEDLGTRTLFGRRVGLHGFGSVARALVPLLRPFGVSMSAYSVGVPEAVIREAGLTPSSSLCDLFRDSEILFECEALTPASIGSVSADVIYALPRGAVFVNVGRGGLVAEDALIRAARAGRIRLALDVVADEPLTAQSPLCRVGDAVLSPHIAGPTIDRYPTIGTHALANLARYLRSEPPAGVITLAAYDRAT